MTKKVLNIVFLLFVTIEIFSQDNVEADKIMTSNKVLNDNDWVGFSKDNYSIQLPFYWGVDTFGQMGTRFIILSPQESETDSFRENVNLLIQDLKGKNFDLNRFVKLTEKQIIESMSGSKIQLSKWHYETKNLFHEMIYTAVQSGFHLQFKQYFWFENEKAIILTYTCEQKECEKYNAIGDKILKSFKMEPKF